MLQNATNMPPPTPTPVTVRLAPELKADGDAYAARLGLSFNALLSVALRDYLDARQVKAPPFPSPPAKPASHLPAPGLVQVPKLGRAARRALEKRQKKG
jgi:hypothetical protein